MWDVLKCLVGISSPIMFQCAVDYKSKCAVEKSNVSTEKCRVSGQNDDLCEAYKTCAVLNPA